MAAAANGTIEPLELYLERNWWLLQRALRMRKRCIREVRLFEENSAAEPDLQRTPVRTAWRTVAIKPSPCAPFGGGQALQMLLAGCGAMP